MKVKDIIAVLEEFAPLGIQEKWDNSGLIIGSPDNDVHGVMLGFDCTPELIDEAALAGCDMVVTHHPLIFKGMNHIDPFDYPVGAAVYKAVQAGIAVYAAHTTADKVIAGVSGAMARRLGLLDIEVLEPEEDGSVGLGAVGNLPVPMTAGEVLEMVKERFGLGVIRHSRPVEGLISRIAVLGGSGGGDIPAARASGAQLYITADISYHNFFTSGDFMLMDIGHFESEVEIVDILLALIRKKIPNFADCVRACVNRNNPVHYFGI